MYEQLNMTRCCGGKTECYILFIGFNLPLLLQALVEIAHGRDMLCNLATNSGFGSSVFEARISSLNSKH